MAKAYSIDLRTRVLHYLKKNSNKEAASQLFQVSRATIYRWLARNKEKGHVNPIKRKYAYKKVEDEKLRHYIEENPEDFLYEIANHFQVKPATIFYACKRLKITRKKRHYPIKKKMLNKEQNF